MVGGRGLMATAPQSSKGRLWRWIALLGFVVLAWSFYAAPASLANRWHDASEQPGADTTLALINARVDFAKVHPQLSGELRRATGGRLTAPAFAQLLLYGWLPQQRKIVDEPLPAGVSARSRQTRIYLVRYKGWNRAMATFWDANHFHQIILTLERENIFGRWQVTKVAQFNICPHDFDCAHVPNPQAKKADPGLDDPHRSKPSH